MAKDLPYFKFGVSNWINGNITLEDDSAQGLFVNICAHYWFKSGELKLSEIQKRLSRSKKEDFDSLIKNGIIKVKKDIISIEFLDEQLSERGAISAKNSENGKKGGRGKRKEVALIDESQTKAVALIDESQTKANESNIEEKRGEENRIEENTTTPLPPSSTVVDSVVVESPIEIRKEKFIQSVNEIGGMTYTRQMLDNFILFWTEPDRGKKQKMKFEKQKTWETNLRLQRWAKRNFDNIVCLLTESEKTIKQKKKEFYEAMREFEGKYSKDMLNAFYRHWSQPENKADPQKLRWELQEFWDLSTRLVNWKENNFQTQEQPQVVYTIPNGSTQ